MRPCGVDDALGATSDSTEARRSAPGERARLPYWCRVCGCAAAGAAAASSGRDSRAAERRIGAPSRSVRTGDRLEKIARDEAGHPYRLVTAEHMDFVVARLRRT